LKRLGSMLWQHFSAILVNFRREKIGVSLKNLCYDHFFNLALFRVKKHHFSPIFLAKIFLKS
jgi:hypothetical protein